MISEEIYSRQVRTSRRPACGRCSTHSSRICRRRFGLVFVLVTVLILTLTVVAVLSMAGNAKYANGIGGQQPAGHDGPSVHHAVAGGLRTPGRPAMRWADVGPEVFN